MDEKKGTPIMFFYSDQDYKKFMDYLVFKAENTLFKILKDEGEDFTWRQFVEIIRHVSDLQAIIFEVIFRGIGGLVQKWEVSFTPSEREGDACDELEIDFTLPFSEICDPLQLAWLLVHIIHLVEKLHYERLTKMGAIELTFEEYIQKSEGDENVIRELIYGFTDAIRRIGMLLRWTDDRVEAARGLCEIYPYSQEEKSNETD